MASNDLQNFTGIEFQDIKESLKSFLRNQDTLKDYDFDASTINILLDVLAYNTQYNAFYLNMLASERFIATAQRRSSLIQIARTLGYVPLSVRPSFAFVNLKIAPVEAYTGPIVIPKGFVFTTRLDEITYRFITRQENIINISSDGFYYINDLEIYQGKLLTYNYTVVNGETGFTLPNRGVDTTTLSVRVFQGPSDTTGVQYDVANDYSEISADDTRFFVEEVDGEYHRIYFGDDVIGLRVSTGNRVRVEYYVSDGSDANGARFFIPQSDLANADTIEIVSEIKSQGGSDIESPDSIRLNAPLFFQRQNRAITSSDFASIVRELYPAAKSVSAWGGENQQPPRYGFAYISILPESGTVLSEQTKLIIERRLKQRYTNLATTPVIIDPEYLYLRVRSLVNYDSRKTNPGALNLRAGVVSTIRDYSESRLNQFNAALRYSKLLSAIDNYDQSIVSNETEIELYVEYVFLEKLIKNRSFNFKQAITENTIRSNVFVYDGLPGHFISSSPTFDGFLALFRIGDSEGTQLIQDRAFVVDYTAGVVSINSTNFDPESVELNIDNPLQLYAIPETNDVSAAGNTILAFKDSDIFVEAQDVSTGASTGTLTFIT